MSETAPMTGSWRPCSDVKLRNPEINKAPNTIKKSISSREIEVGGTATITAKSEDSGKTATCTVTVKVKATGIALHPP